MVRRFTANVAALINCAALFFGTEAIAACDASKQCCAAGSSGATCGGSGVASQGNSSGTNLGGGNPINVVTGNKYQREVDLAPLPGVLGLEIIRHYNSSTSGLDRPAREMRGIGGTVGVLGRGWKLSYETDLYIRPDGILDVIQADGTRITFRKGMVDPSVYYPRSPSQGRIVLTDTSTKPGYAWIWNNGRRLTFDENGLLTRIRAPTGEIVTLTRTINGWLGRVTDPQGRTLILQYPTKSSPDYKTEFHGVYAIDSPVGRFGYEYGSKVPPGADIRRARLGSNLVKVTLPTFHDPSQQADAYPGRGVSSSSIARIYHYESAQFPTLLTGVTVVGQGSDGQIIQQRTGTYGYDPRGRGNLSVRGEADSHREQVTVAWPQPAQAILTNSLGQQTTYKTATIAGEARILEVTGAGCASCGPANMRYGYDSLGRLTEETRITSTGEPIETRQTTLDGYGRPLQISRVAYLNGKPQPAKPVLRYQYAVFDEQAARKDPTRVPGDQPVLIARPSVVPGMEHQLKIRYNEYGQPLTITETGYDPVEGPTTQLTRTTRYRYSLVGENSVLTEIDGPLANGPKGDTEDSDVTRITWNKSGTQVTAVTWPGGTQSLASYDQGTGLISKIEDEAGLQTRFVHNPRAELTSISTTGPGWTHPRVQSFFYDAFGNRTETGTGSKTNQTYQGEIRQEFDAIGRPIWIASALGILQRFEFDTESHLLESSRSDGSMRQAQNFAYDGLGRLVALSDSSGFDLKLNYGARGEVDQYTDSFGREHRLDGSNESPPGVQTVYDDFGRRVLSISPDRGRTTRSFDAANRMTGSVDAIGNAAKYEYDVTGRIARQTITPVATAAGQATPQVTTWTYEGRKLVAVDHPVQSERYVYDERGVLIAKQVVLKQPAGIGRLSVTRYRYDDEGHLTSASLPDGSRLIYERNGQGQLVALHRSRIQTAWLQWLLPARRIVTAAERDLVGVKRYVAGNGIEARYQRSREGALARMVYANARLANEADARSTVAATTMQGVPASREDGSNGAPQDGPGITKVSTQAPGAINAAEIQGSLLDHRYLWDVGGNLLLTQTPVAGTVSGKPANINSYAYDERDRLIATASLKGASRYYFDDTGNRILSQEAVADQADLVTGTRKADFRIRTHRAMQDGVREFEHDENGRVIRDGSRSYEWDALGRLVAVRTDAKLVGQYAYNHRGERVHKEVDHSGSRKGTSYLYENRLLVAELNEAGNVVREYVYLGNQVVATIDLGAGHQLASAEEGTWAQVLTDLGTVIDGWFGSSETITWLHANHLGLVEAATNRDGQLVWQAEYDAMGRLLPVSSASETPKTATAYAMNLRFPGQYHDAETGLYYNGYRYYDPDTGRYLSTDPLGLPDGPNPYAYVASNPLKYIDPLGLVLFAFDGTGNSAKTDAETSLSNVYKFYEAYDQHKNGTAYYITGIGTTDENMKYEGNVATGDGFDQRVAQGFKFLEDEINAHPTEPSTMKVDVVGFSRGAAEARVWINLLAKKLEAGRYTAKTGYSRCIDIRFEGLWDTVPHLGLLNGKAPDYDFSIPSAVGYAVHAVAMNEHRGGAANFNGRSIFNEPQTEKSPATPNRVEIGLVGSHSDIGGGYTTGDLSNVALMWMIEQAKTRGIKFSNEIINTNKWNTVKSPILHDKSLNNRDPRSTTYETDRKFTYGNGTSVDQHVAVVGGNNTDWARGEVKYYGTSCGPGWATAVGLVKMNDYAKWLESHGVSINYVVPASRKVCE